MESADLILNSRWIVPVEPRGTVLEDQAIVLADGRIADILPVAEAAEKYEAAETISRPSHVAIPGLVNAHTHAAMTLFRGLADDMPLAEWLEQHIWPAEMRWAGPEFVRDGTELAIIEMLRSGTTCFNDMYFFPDVVAKAAVDYGIRAVVGMIVIGQPTAWARSTDEYFSKGLAVHDQFRGHPLVRTAFAPHAPYSVGQEAMRNIRVLADQLDTPVHMHVHETAAEIDTALQVHGMRPLARLKELGLVNSQLTAVHMTQLEADEIAMLAELGADVVHCPESNMKLASGFCPVAELLQGGVNVALGTDGAGSNNDLDMFAEMRTAALLAKLAAGDASAVSAEQALAMATINGARALGLDDEIGSLEVGKSGDIVCVNLEAAASQPVHHPISLLVYSVCREQVSDVWIAGRHLVTDGRMPNEPLQEIMSRVEGWRRRLLENHD